MLMDVTWEEFWQIRVEEAEEIGEKKAWKKAEEKAEAKERKLVLRLLSKGYTADQIQELTEVPVAKILEIKAAMNV